MTCVSASTVIFNSKSQQTNGYQSNQSEHHIAINGHDMAPTFAGEVRKRSSTIYVNTFSHSEIALASGPIPQCRTVRDIADPLGT